LQRARALTEAAPAESAYEELEKDAWESDARAEILQVLARRAETLQKTFAKPVKPILDGTFLLFHDCFLIEVIKNAPDIILDHLSTIP